jgi:hypothetical protein
MIKSQAETIADLDARCAGPNQFENFDRAFRRTLTVPKEALLREEADRKRARAKKRSRKTG